MSFNPEFVSDADGQAIALFVPSQYRVNGIEFLTNQENNFQLGLMLRDQTTPVAPHIHNRVERSILGTQEFLYVQEGSMEVSLYDAVGNLLKSLTVCTGDFILLISGGHSIEFLEPCRLIELKQGPYTQAVDKQSLILHPGS
jgi:hypothetical protein